MKIPLGTIVAFALRKENIPEGWLPCDGSEIPSDYQELATALGSTKTPNLQGLFLLGVGNAESGNSYTLGQQGGEETHSLSIAEMPKHSHNYEVTKLSPKSAWLERKDDWNSSSKSPATTSTEGNSKPHNNMPPFYAINYIIYAEAQQLLNP